MGPTASGKSSFALELAQELNGAIINADSLQWFKDLPILTAQPSAEEKTILPHYLYGELGPFEQPTAHAWRLRCLELINQLGDKMPIFVGGTGLYLMALLKGLSPIPTIHLTFREQAMLLSKQDNFYDFVLKTDPLVKDLYHPNDNKRLVRALEISLQTGNSITSYLDKPHSEGLEDRAFKIYLKPDRDRLYKQIGIRLEAAVKMGAVEEVKALYDKEISLDAPVFKALGAKEIASYLNGYSTYQQMFDIAYQKTRNYAKRQYTWFNHQMNYDVVTESQNVKAIISQLS